MILGIGSALTGQRCGSGELGCLQLSSSRHKHHVSGVSNWPHPLWTASLLVCVSELGLSRWGRVGLFQHLRKRKCVSQKHLREGVQVLCIFLRVIVGAVHSIIAFKANMLRPLLHRRSHNSIGQSFNPLFQIDSSGRIRINRSRCQLDRTPEHCASGVRPTISTEIIESGKKCCIYFRGDIRWSFRCIWCGEGGYNIARRCTLSASPCSYVNRCIANDGNNPLSASLALQKKESLADAGFHLGVAPIRKPNFFSSAVWAFQRELRHV